MPRVDEFMRDTWWKHHICAKTSQLMCLTCEKWKTSQKEHKRQLVESCTQGQMT